MSNKIDVGGLVQRVLSQENDSAIAVPDYRFEGGIGWLHIREVVEAPDPNHPNRTMLYVYTCPGGNWAATLHFVFKLNEYFERNGKLFVAALVID